uniref:Sugar phosphate transporter domain-containing protein n=1 Tax=Ditylenchus dipsaci TaxID=166011 RepID=A0A915DLB5_9BILA
MWLGSSTCQSIVNKMALNEYPYPLTISLSSLLNNVIYAIPLLKILHIVPVRVSPSYLMKTVVLSVLAELQQFPLLTWVFPKCLFPMHRQSKLPCPFYGFYIEVMLNEKQSGKVYISLAPILFGLVSSLLSTFIFAFLNVLAKKVFEETGMHPIVLLSLNSQMASVILFPVWLFRDGQSMWAIMTQTSAVNSQKLPDSHFLFYLFVSGICSFIQNLCAFALIHQLTTLSYSVSNATKKIFVICLSLIWLRNPVTPLNLCGMAITIVGVFIYNRVKSSEKKKKQNTDSHPKLPDEEALLRRHGEKLSFEMGKMHSSNSDVRLLMSMN